MEARTANRSAADAPGRGETSRATEKSFRKRNEDEGKAGDFVVSEAAVADKYSVDMEGGDDGDDGDDETVVRKRLGCRRRTLKDRLSAEDDRQQREADRKKDAMILLDCILEKTQTPSHAQRKNYYRSFRRAETTRRRLVFTSPRVISSDEDLFPTDHSPYMQSNQRWQQISKQAGCHRQEGIVMNIGRKPASAKAFRIGMIESAAVRVRSLNLWLNHRQDTLPDWLDMIGEVFVNLEHLTLTEDIFPGEIEMAVSARMRRLYVLSILPNLKSIDDMVVTSKERKMANPNGFAERSPRVKTCETRSEKESENKPIDPDGEHQDPSPTNRSIEEGGDPRVLSPSNNSNSNINNNSNNEPIENDDDQRDDSEGTADAPVPVSINTDSVVGSARANGNAIEVEIVDREFREMKLMGTQTTASTSPASNAESTITAADSNEDDERPDESNDECEYEYGGGLNKIVVVAKTDDDSRERGLNAPSDEEISVGGAGKRRRKRNGAVDSAIRAEGDDVRAAAFERTSGSNNGTPSLADGAGGDVNENGDETENENETNCAVTVRRSIRKQLDGDDSDGDPSDTIELVSVASHDLEWTAACGILTFRTDRACAPRIRLPFSSSSSSSSRDKKTDATTEACQKAVENLRKKEREKGSGGSGSSGGGRLNSCTPVNRQSEAVARTPQVGCCPILKNDAFPQTKFLFPAEAKGGGLAPSEKPFEFHHHLSANQQLPPSKSLSSPFPMQFRERQKLATACSSNSLGGAQLVVNTSDSMEVRTGSSRDSKDGAEMETIASPLSIVTSPVSSSSSPEHSSNNNNKPKKANKGELPPKCPSGGTRRQGSACKILKHRKQKTNRRRKLNEASKESARSISVMDLDDDDEFCDENLENSEEIESSVDRSNQVVTVM